MFRRGWRGPGDRAPKTFLPRLPGKSVDFRRHTLPQAGSGGLVRACDLSHWERRTGLQCSSSEAIRIMAPSGRDSKLIRAEPIPLTIADLSRIAATFRFRGRGYFEGRSLVTTKPIVQTWKRIILEKQGKELHTCTGLWNAQAPSMTVEAYRVPHVHISRVL